MEYVTLISSLIYLIVTINGYYRKRELEYLSFLISSIAFFVISIALVIMGLDALALPYTVYLGSIYPSFLALGLLIHKKTEWKYYLYFIILMLVLIAIGQVALPALKTGAQVTLHTISGLIIVFLPLIEVLSKRWGQAIYYSRLGDLL